MDAIRKCAAPAAGLTLGIATLGGQLAMATPGGDDDEGFSVCTNQCEVVWDVSTAQRDEAAYMFGMQLLESDLEYRRVTLIYQTSWKPHDRLENNDTVHVCTSFGTDKCMTVLLTRESGFIGLGAQTVGEEHSITKYGIDELRKALLGGCPQVIEPFSTETIAINLANGEMRSVNECRVPLSRRAVGENTLTMIMPEFGIYDQGFLSDARSPGFDALQSLCLRSAMAHGAFDVGRWAVLNRAIHPDNHRRPEHMPEIGLDGARVAASVERGLAPTEVLLSITGSESGAQVAVNAIYGTGTSVGTLGQNWQIAIENAVAEKISYAPHGGSEHALVWLGRLALDAQPDGSYRLRLLQAENSFAMALPLCCPGPPAPGCGNQFECDMQ